MKYVLKILLLSLFGLTACIDTMNLPTLPDDVIVVINQEDENYTEIMPRWDESLLGISNFNDFYFAKDGRLFIADSSSQSIFVFRESGVKAADIYTILEKPLIDNSIISPVSVCVNSKFMVLFSDGKDKIYAWNQFIAQSDVVAVIDSFDISNGVETRTIAPNQIYQMDTSFTAVEGSEQLNSSNETIESLSKLFTFYDPTDARNTNINPQYSYVEKELISLAPGESESDYVFATDRKNNRILKIEMVIENIVVLDNGLAIFTYKGVFDSFIATPGTGAGTVSNPTGLVSDEYGNILYSQLGDYFSVHKLSNPSYTSPYVLGIDDIMELDQFSSAMDLTVDNKGSIFVVDSTQNVVKKFNSKGEFIKLLGVEETWVKIQDTLTTIIGTDTLITYKDTLIQNIKANILNRPSVITEYNGVIYVGDSGNKRILRYTLADGINIEPPVN